MAYALSTQNYQELLNFCTKHAHDRQDAADLVHEAYARALGLVQRSADGQEAVQDLRALLYRTLRNLMIDQHRRNVLRQHESLEQLADVEAFMVPSHLQPEEMLAFSHYAKVMFDAIEALPPRCREAFILSRFEGWSQQEIAAHMGISRNMVAQHIVRAMLSCKAAHQEFHQQPD